MSGHNPPHGRLGQPNSTWNPLQVPSYIPRQPQLAHMSSERSLARSPLTWHTPPTHQDQLYNFMTANHKNNLEINPMLPTFGRSSGMPLGSVDLSLSSAARSTPSPKGNNLQPGPAGPGQQHPSSLHPNIPPGLGGPPMPDQNDHFHPKMVPGHGQQQHHMNTNHNRSPSATQIGSVIQSTAALKDRSGHNLIGGNSSTPCNFLGTSGSSNNIGLGSGSAGGNGYYNMMSSNSSGSSSNNSTCVGGSNSINRPPVGPVSGTAPSPTMGVAGDFAALIPGGLHIKDAKQINNEAGGKNGRDNIPVITEPSDLVKDILMHAMQSNPVPVLPKRSSPLRTLVPPNQSPTRSRGPPASMMLQSMDQPSAACVSKSFQMISANVPSTPEAANTTAAKANSPSAATPVALPAKAATTARSDRTSPNQSITSNEDSADSNSSKSRRRRKPDRTNKMGADELERMHDFLGSDNSTDKCDRIEGIDPMRPNIAVRNDIATLALEGITSLSQGLASDSSHSPHITDLSDSTRLNLQNLNESNSNPVGEANKSPAVSSVISSVLSAAAAVMESVRKESESNSDDCETIDKIAAMISSTENENAPAQTPLELPTAAANNNENGSCNGPSKENVQTEGSLPSGSEKPEGHKNDTDKSYEEIENKLEEMFAGIEETMPSCSKSLPAAEKNSPLAKQSNESTDILTALSEKSEESTSTATSVPLAKARNDSPEPGTSGTQKKVLTPAAKRANVGKPSAASGTPPNKRKKVLKKKPVQSKGSSFAAAEERAGSFGAKAGKKPLAKGNGKKGNGSGQTVKNVKVKQSDSGGTLDPNGKYKGPYVQVKSDGGHMVINAPINEDDSDKPPKQAKKFGNSMNNSEKSKIRGLHVSTLSTKYDADTTDISWMCVFCKLGPHKLRLGDLFGPYIISIKSSEFEHSQTDSEYFNVKRTRESLASKFASKAKAGSDAADAAPKSKKRKAGEVAVPSVAPSTSSAEPIQDSESTPSDMFYGMVKAGDDSYEVWMHEDCLIWAPGVHIIGTRVVGLEAAIWNCCRHQCRICSHHGAMVSCLHRGCDEEAHVMCARKNNWELNDEFKSHCDQHSKVDS